MTTQTLLETWTHLDRIAHEYLAPITNDEQHARALDLLGEVWAQVGASSDHPLGTLLQLLIDHVNAYEDERHPVPDAVPHVVLAFLMEQRGVGQSEVARATGIDQGNLSRLLAGRRELNVAQIRALSAYFHVSPAVLVG
ncbi:helix-turn-helix domain-containing protein [Deinococcus pimensis]|uniref:helix-turn-helix domain-containing protein n=1 Tax=Deinococcus pimensis TaxID=309888 RepID=UPI0004B19DDA|nr:helix-turn-helix domain-containing protein [Deinococcus pimensis]